MAIAAEIDSPFAVTSAESAELGIERSRRVGLETSVRHGPGESPDIRGDGKGVTSGIALSIGEDMAELVAELDKMFFMLGVRAIDGFVAICENSPELRAVAAVTVYPGIIFVCIRKPELKGLDRPSSGESCMFCEREGVSSGDKREESCLVCAVAFVAVSNAGQTSNGARPSRSLVDVDHCEDAKSVDATQLPFNVGPEVAGARCDMADVLD